jgi:NADH-quinone oxidoreductase subunit J
MVHLGFVNFIMYFFMLVTTVAGGGMMIKKNPVHSVLCLILSFCGGAGLLLINNAEFLAFIVLTVYVGAVMVLFLFVVMMIDVDSIHYTKNSVIEKISVFAVAMIIFSCMYITIDNEIIAKVDLMHKATEIAMNSISENVNQAKEFGKIIYKEDNSIIVIICSMILFVGIIGSIILTIRDRVGLKKQNLFSQLLRSREDTLEIKKVLVGSGVEDE